MLLVGVIKQAGDIDDIDQHICIRNAILFRRMLGKVQVCSMVVNALSNQFCLVSGILIPSQNLTCTIGAEAVMQLSF